MELIKQQQQQQRLKLLEKIYKNPASPAGFSGHDQLYKEALKLDPKIKRKDVQLFLESDRTYTLHKPRRVNFKRSKTIASGFMTDVQCDLADMQKLSRDNKGFRYILIGIDVLSKRVFAAPIKSKKFKDMREGFDHMFVQMPRNSDATPYLPHRIFTDRGTEFESKEMKQYFDEKGIEKLKANTSAIKAALAERCIRNVKQRLYRYFSEKHTLIWMDVLPKIIDAINHSKCRVTGMKPIDVNFKNAQSVWLKVYGNPYSQSSKLPRYRKGDAVRIARDKGIFEKGYWPNFSDEIVEIDSVKRSNPHTYKLKDERGEMFKNKFYEQEIGKTKKNAGTSYRIEKVIRKRKRKGKLELFVKFIGYPSPEWILESDLV